MQQCSGELLGGSTELAHIYFCFEASIGASERQACTVELEPRSVIEFQKKGASKEFASAALLPLSLLPYFLTSRAAA